MTGGFDLERTKRDLLDEIERLRDSKKPHEDALKVINSDIQRLSGFLDALSGRTPQSESSGRKLTHEGRELKRLAMNIRWGERDLKLAKKQRQADKVRELEAKIEEYKARQKELRDKLKERR